MNAAPRTLLAACFLAGAAGGWLATHRAAPAGAETTGGTSGIPARPDRPRPARNAEREMIATAMAPIRAAGDRWSAIEAAVALAHRIPPEDIARWLHNDLFKHPDGILESVFYRTLRDRFFELDPAACIAGMRERNHSFTWEYARRWAEADPLAALEAVEKDPALRSTLLGHALTALAKTDPSAVFSRLEALKLDRNNVHQLNDVFRALADTDPLGLLERAKGWKGGLEERARQTALAHWLKKDASACLDWLAADPKGKSLFLNALRSSHETGKALVARLHQLPPGWADSLADSSITHSLTHGAGEEWLAADLAGAGISAGNALKVRAWAILDIAGKDPARAVAIYHTLEGLDENTHQNLIGNLAGRLAGGDPALARQWAGSLDEPFRTQALAQIDSQEASRNASANPDRPVAEKFQEVIAGTLHSHRFGEQGWSPQTLGEAVEAIRTLDAGEIREFATKVGGSNYLPYPVHAELIQRQLADGGDDAGANVIRNAANTAGHWASEDPAAASGWVATLPEGEARHWAVLNLAAEWNRHDPDAAGAWISSLKSEQDREAARQGLAPAK